jgi:hypothetical protein
MIVLGALGTFLPIKKVKYTIADRFGSGCDFFVSTQLFPCHGYQTTVCPNLTVDQIRLIHSAHLRQWHEYIVSRILVTYNSLTLFLPSSCLSRLRDTNSLSRTLSDSKSIDISPVFLEPLIAFPTIFRSSTIR